MFKEFAKKKESERSSMARAVEDIIRAADEIVKASRETEKVDTNARFTISNSTEPPWKD
jgi:hypothetical protein